MSQEPISDVCMTEEETFKDKALVGATLGEVFSIIIDTGAFLKCEMYGTIRVDDCNGSFCIYDVKSEDSIAITKPKNLALPHGTRAICAEDGFTLSFDLRDKNREGAEFIRGHFRWETTDSLRKNIVTNVTGLYGSAARVEYAVFPGAIEANIWAEFYSENKIAHSCGFDLKGSIVLRYKYKSGNLVRDLDDPNKCYEISLLDLGVSEVHDNDLFPLERSVVILPIGFALSIDVDLKGITNEGKVAFWAFNVQFCSSDITVSSYREHTEEDGVIKLGCVGFEFLDTLEVIEGEKEYLRKIGKLF